MIIERSSSVYYGYPTINVYYNVMNEEPRASAKAEAKRWARERGQVLDRFTQVEMDTYSHPTLTVTYRCWFKNED